MAAWHPESPVIRCDLCVYFSPIGVRPSYGKCHRFPPQVSTYNGDIQESFPTVAILDWCGEWKMIEDTESDSNES